MDHFKQNDFIEYFRLVENFDASNPLFKNYSEGEYNLYTDDDIKSYTYLLKKFYTESNSLKYIKSISINPAIRKTAFKADAAYFEWLSGFLKNRLDLFKADSEKKYLYESAKTSQSPSNSYLYFVSKELYSYLFIDKNDINKDRKELKEKLNQYLCLQIEIRELISKLGYQEMSFSRSFTKRHNRGELIQEFIENIRVEKNSHVLREKIFVQKLIKLNEDYFRKPCINLIQEIMCLPCFERQIDISTISRIRRQMQGQKRRRFERNLPM